MEVEEFGAAEQPPSMTYDEVSLERSKSFVKALQELKNLRSQLYSAAEYCEKSYLHSERKQMVLVNLKDYVVRALVNAVDHLGTVAYKLTDLLDQHSIDISSMELKITCVNQQLLTCQTFTEKEGLRQQQLLTIIPKHHKHYTLPNSVNKKVHFSPRIQMDPRQQIHAKPRLYPSVTPAAKTLSWHLASETKSSLKASLRSSLRLACGFHLRISPTTGFCSANFLLIYFRSLYDVCLSFCSDDSKSSRNTSASFSLRDAEQMKSPTAHSHLPSVGPASTVAMQTLGISQWDALEGRRPMTPFRSFDNTTRREIVAAPARSKSVLSTLFVKQKAPKLKTFATS